MLSPRENILKALRRENPEYVPIDMGFCPFQVEAFKGKFGHEDYLSFFGVSHRSGNITLSPSYKNGTELYDQQLPESIDFDAWGIGHAKGSESAMHMTRLYHPLKGDKTLKDIEDYPMPKIVPGELEKQKNHVEQLHTKGLAAKGHLAQTIWETSWCIRDMENLMVDMSLDDPKASVLLDKVTEVSVLRAQIYAKAGYDILHLGDDIGTQKGPMMSVEMWRKWLKPRLLEVIEAALKEKPDMLIFYHSCGYITPFLEELIEIGVDILNPIQPECMDFEEVYNLVGNKVSFWGTIGTQQLLPFGKPDEIKMQVIKNVRICGEKGGIVIAPTHLIEPEVPWENLMSLYDSASKISYKDLSHVN